MRYSPLLLMVSSTLAWSEISSLTASELTDTYIKDTTVIVRPAQAPTEPVDKVRVTLKVSPIEETTQVLSSDEERDLAAISEELNSYTELNERAALTANLQSTFPIATTDFLTAPPSDSVLNQVRAAYGLDPGAPVDLASLSFLSNLTPDLGLSNPSNASYSTTSDSFTIRIPNVGNFNTQNIASPNGEVGVNVTPSHIEYTLNLPR
jgi:hypothetical protein